ncbi:hypothetical protein FE391_29770 [Nonomuraea sp. KC401]|uniref:hypothetical protein n=1 Tax=unclassified Nonomuraea TaxID=2593643 RepID=UPI0010FEF52A|nr:MULTISPECIES: hypothetical protein [unclassified Nonomuraea]NBE93385.1 hypothetical protein [Nonomuraea sp. K271]TLF62676.1 hypothetical protein FE391_29770 [Nonomuraea sp. KC401]
MSSPETLYAYNGIKKRAGAICDTAEDIRVARRDWKHEIDSPEAEFELHDPAAALAEVRDAWEKEFSVYHEVLERWCLATRASAAGFESIDDYLESRAPASGDGS